MTFESIAEDLDRLLTQHPRSQENSEELLLDVRSCATRAGYCLIKAMKLGHVSRPNKRYFWLSAALDKRSPSAFRGLRDPYGFQATWSGPRRGVHSLGGMIQSLRIFQGELSNPLLGSLGESEGGFIHRHVFYEAITDWLRSRHPEEIGPVRLLEWEAIKIRGQPRRFVTDHTWIHSSRARLPNLRLMIAACRDGCRVLHSLMAKQEGPGSEARVRGRPLASDPKEDKRMSELWKSGRFKTHEELGRSQGRSASAIQRAVDRHRHRRKHGP